MTKSLQTECHWLAECRYDLDQLTAGIEEDRTDVTKILHGGKLGRMYIGTDSYLVMNENCETGVFKLQRGKLDSLTDAEKAAVRMLKVDDDVESTNAAALAGKFPSSMEARLSKKRRVTKAADIYMPCGFIRGSSAAV